MSLLLIITDDDAVDEGEKAILSFEVSTDVNYAGPKATGYEFFHDGIQIDNSEYVH